ncbi:MAG: YjbQ family protein [Spirochaetes bacterium]|nr:YjbQ family protein [Spirochaetota bacterium]
MGATLTSFGVETKGETDIVDITDSVTKIIQDQKVQSGTATVFVKGSTAGISTIEYEPGLVSDLKSLYERLAPRQGEYLHNLRWGDKNGFSHIRASLTGQSFSFPVSGKQPLLGTWQQIILIDFDNRPRNREVVVQIVGE